MDDVQKIVSRLKPIDDIFFQKLVEDKGFCEELLQDVYVIYISSFDIFKASHVIYHVDRVVRETSQVVDNGFHEIYVNTKVDDGSEISGLMQLFNKSSIPNDKRYPNVCNAIRSFKEGKGENNMCEEVERYAQQYAQHAVAEEREKTEKEREKAEKEREKAEKEREKAIANIVNVYRQTDSPIDIAIKNIMKMYDYSAENATEIVKKYWDRQ